MPVGKAVPGFTPQLRASPRRRRGARWQGNRRRTVYSAPMPLPKQRISKRRRDFRRSHHALQLPTLNLCPQCKQPRRPHRVCPNCGHYDGREVIETD